MESMGKAGYDLARKNFDPKVNMGKVQKIYKEVLKFSHGATASTEVLIIIQVLYQLEVY